LIASSLSEFLKTDVFSEMCIWFWWRNTAKLPTSKQHAYNGIVVPEGWTSCLSSHWLFYSLVCFVVLWYGL